MAFYQDLTPYYDELFPVNEKQLRYITSYYAEGSSLLDMGAGTGNMACALAEAGYSVTAAEPEEMMCARIREKSKSYGQRLQVLPHSMQELDQLTDYFDGIYCVGNTLVHLQDLKEISQFLQHAYTRLRPEGTLLIQIVNYDKVLNSDGFKFPVVRKEHFTFERSYELAGDKVLFTTTLTANDQAISNTVPLFPVTCDQLLPILEQCGYHHIEAYANFEKAPYTPEAPALVLAAHK